MSRLSQGGLIDRGQPLAFTFDGKSFSGFAGDTLASALVANDVKLLGRSFKYHRPRGLMSAGSEESNALVTLNRGGRSDPNTRATLVELFDGLEAISQNRWPSLAFDLMAINQAFSPLLVAGFYYKTFMWPAWCWERLYEPLIRRAAGLGRLSGEPDPDTYDREHGFCDLLVIGGGAAGLLNALSAARAGLRVFLVDENPQFGGQLLNGHHFIDEMKSFDWVAETVAELSTLPNVRLLNRTTVVGIYDGREYVAAERVSDHCADIVLGKPRQRLWKIIAKSAVLASGAIERPIVFGGNDRPGVMLASAVSTYINRFAALPGRRAVIFTSTDSGWQTALDIARAGGGLEAIVEARPTPPALASDPLLRGVPVYCSSSVSDAIGVPLKKVRIRSNGRTIDVGADLLAISGGWNPTIGLGSNLGARPIWSESHAAFLLKDCPPGLVPCGAAAGHFGLCDAVRHAGEVATALLEEFGRSQNARVALQTSDDPANMSPFWHVTSRQTKAFVDFQHDVTDTDVALATREGFCSVEHFKRYTTLGMATDQGKTSSVTGQALLAAATGKSIAEAGVVLSRPPFQPVALGLIAGRHTEEDFRPIRRTSAHDWAAEQGAIFVDAAHWKRAQWFPREGDGSWRDGAEREVRQTRGAVGVCDVSTLGKIEIQGPDAGTLLDRLYINSFSTLKVGKTKYGVMLREDGFVLDDGTTARLSENLFFMTTTTANAERVMQHIDFARQVLWPTLDVQAVSVTEQWSTFAIAGPRSRDLVQAVLPDVDLSNDAVPFMAAIECQWDGQPARVSRISFSGELAYEVSVPAAAGDRFIRHIFAAGKKYRVTPYGLEALNIMRIEKGHVTGSELNGQTTASDLGMERLFSQKKDFIGRVMASRAGLVDEARPRLVGLRAVDASEVFTAGSHLVRPGEAAIAANDEGHVTSAAFSPTLGCGIALALLAYGASRHGERIVAHDLLRGNAVEAEIGAPVFLDPAGERLRG